MAWPCIKFAYLLENTQLKLTQLAKKCRYNREYGLKESENNNEGSNKDSDTSPWRIEIVMFQRTTFQLFPLSITIILTQSFADIVEIFLKIRTNIT